MTPQERQLMVQLFERLAALENSPRDPDAEAMIREGFRRAPNAAYALVQTVLLQDEALKAANAHIQEFEQANGGPPQPEGQPRGFLDQMRESVFGRDEPRGSVPRVPLGTPSGARPDPWGQQHGYQGQTYQNQAGYPNQGAPMQAPPQQGSSFLGTAAAAAAGVIGGSLLMGGIRSAMGGGHHASSPAAGALDSLSGQGGSPRSGNAAGSDLSRDAGLDDIGGSRLGGNDPARPAGLFDSAQNDSEGDAGYDDDSGDDAGFDGGDSDTA